MTRLKYSLLVIFALLAGCSYKCDDYSCRDEKRLKAVHLAQKILMSDSEVKVSPLKGGLSGSSLYKVSINKRSLAIRFIDHHSLQDRQREIDAQNKASQYGYGPKIYYSDALEGIIAMDFLESHPITDEIRKTPSFYCSLGTLLRSIHAGPKFKQKTSILDKIKRKIKDIGWEKYSLFERKKVEHLFINILEILKTHPDIRPTHNDLNPNNIILSNGKLYVIDYEDASQGDPYFDLATIGIFYLFDETTTKIFLKSYFGRPPTRREEARFQLMKIVVLIYYGLEILSKIHEDQNEEKSLYYPLNEAFKMFEEKKINLESTSGKKLLSNSMIGTAILDFNSNKYKKYINILLK